METNFYEEIAHKIYTYQTQIGVTNFDLLEYIEERHKSAPFKGSTFYSNLIHALPNHFGAKMFPDKFKEVLLYCKSKIDNKMLLGDYAKIILRGLYNSPNFLVEHLKRELTKVEAQGFTKAEFEFDLRETITIMKNRINELYETDLKKYEKYEEEDKSLPKANKNYYPKPDKNAISITNFKLPEGTAFHLPKPIFLNDLEKVENALNEVVKTNKLKDNSVDKPQTFEALFFNEKNAEPCLNILRQLQPPIINALNDYIGNAKGVFPLWVKVLKNAKQPLIKHYKDEIYKDLLNQKINGLNLSKDASEFRKTYKRLIESGVEIEMKTILSQLSQKGILGK